VARKASELGVVKKLSSKNTDNSNSNNKINRSGSNSTIQNKSDDHNEKDHVRNL
jgi:hypothetical protein